MENTPEELKPFDEMVEEGVIKGYVCKALWHSTNPVPEDMVAKHPYIYNLAKALKYKSEKPNYGTWAQVLYSVWADRAKVFTVPIPGSPDSEPAQPIRKVATPPKPQPILPERTCPKCGTFAPSNKKFCVGCGTQLPIYSTLIVG
jgi:hypothetical protein